MRSLAKAEVVKRWVHRAGPVEVYALDEGEPIRVQRCLRCDVALIYGGEPGFPLPLGERVPIANGDCPGVLVAA